jgi:hypothetical protein
VLLGRGPLLKTSAVTACVEDLLKCTVYPLDPSYYRPNDFRPGHFPDISTTSVN